MMSWRQSSRLLATLCTLACASLMAVAASGQEQTPLAEGVIDYPLPIWLEEVAAKGAISFEEELVELVNQERWDNGQLPPLKLHAALSVAAEVHSSNMALRNFFSHCDIDTGSSVGDRIADAGYLGNLLGENISAGRSSAQSAIDAWMASPGHRNNILSTGFREIGHGYFHQAADAANVRLDLDSNCVQDGTGGPYRHYWTQTFGRRASGYPVVIEREAWETEDIGVDLYLYGAGWAVDMRLRNDGGAWTPWQPFATQVVWQLSPVAGPRLVEVELRNGVGQVLGSSDVIRLTGLPELIFVDGFESGGLDAWDGN